MNKSIVFALVFMMALFVLIDADLCHWTSHSGKKYNFKASKDLVVADPEAKDINFSFAFCGGTPSNPACAAAPNSPVGCVIENQLLRSVTARWDSKTQGPSHIEEQADGSLILDFDNGDSTTFSLSVTLTCAKTPSISKMYPTSRIEIKGPQGCPSDDDGLSGGAIFLIIVLSLWIAYFIVGFIVCKFVLKKETVTEAIPHFSFWTSLPGFYIAGCKLAISFVMSKIGKKDGGASEYESASDSYGATDDSV